MGRKIQIHPGLFRFAPISSEAVSMYAYVWRSEPPTMDEVRECPWWWMRQCREGWRYHSVPCKLGWASDGLYFDEPGCPRVSEYGDGMEWLPCVAPEMEEWMSRPVADPARGDADLRAMSEG